MLLFDISCKNSPYTSTTAASVLLHVYQGFYITTNTRSTSTKSSVSWRKGLPRPGSHHLLLYLFINYTMHSHFYYFMLRCCHLQKPFCFLAIPFCILYTSFCGAASHKQYCEANCGSGNCPGCCWGIDNENKF